MLGMGVIGIGEVMARGVRARERDIVRDRFHHDSWYEGRLTPQEYETAAKEKAKKEKAKEQAKKAKAKTKLSEIMCPKCKHTGVIKYAQKVHPADTKKPDNEMRYLPVYRCKTCLHEFTPVTSKPEKPTKPAKPKETPHEKEVRVLMEKLTAAQEKFKQHAKLQATLRKENKALKAEVEMLKKEGIFPKGIPGQPKRDPNKDRFANLDL
jgi:rubredoxin